MRLKKKVREVLDANTTTALFSMWRESEIVYTNLISSFHQLEDQKQMYYMPLAFNQPAL